jgi:hypothetical protein
LHSGTGSLLLLFLALLFLLLCTASTITTSIYFVHLIIFIIVIILRWVAVGSGGRSVCGAFGGLASGIGDFGNALASRIKNCSTASYF